MSSFKSRLVTLAISLTAFSAAVAQDAPPPPSPDGAPAPIVRQAPGNQYPPNQYQQNQYAPNQRYAPARRVAQPPANQVSSPAEGIWVRSTPGASVKTVATTADSIELRVDKGVANVSLRHPKENEQILVDMNGGQVALIKDGLYTFNARTNTFRVLEGEAAAYPAGDAKAKPLTVKEAHAVVFGAGSLKAVEFAPFQAHTDVLQGAPGGHEPGYDGPGYYSRGYGYGPYGDGFYGYGYPYYAYGYPYGGWGYPYGFGLGFGYGFGFGYGGYGGFRGGYGGFRR